MLTLALQACSRLTPAPGTLPISSDVGMALLDDWVAASHKTVSLQGMAKVRVTSAGRSLGATQVVLVEAPDHFRAETLSPFGAPLLMLVSDGQSLGALLPGENRFYSGAASPANVQRFTRVPLPPSELVGILLYRPPVINEHSARTFLRPEGGWLLELTEGHRRQELVFSRERRMIEARYYGFDQLELRVSYDQFDTDSFPHEFFLELPALETTASLKFKELSTNREFLPGIFRIEPPAGVQVHSLDDIY